jgi:hypothetical protein
MLKLGVSVLMIIIECGKRWREALAIRDEKEKEINNLEKELLKIKQQ